MIAFTDRHLEIVMTLARELAPEKRATYLLRFAAALGKHAGRITDIGVTEAAQAALASLVQHPTAA